MRASSRRTQPYRKGARQPGHALHAMLQGRTASGYNPMDAQRQLAKKRKGLKHAVRRRMG